MPRGNAIATIAADVSAPPVLSVSNLEVFYNDVILGLRGLSLDVPEGQIVALLGSNGAGKTTLLRAVTGLLEHHEAEITKGRISFRGTDITDAGASSIVRSGVAQVMEGRRIFATLTIDENLRAGAFTVRDRGAIAANHQRVMDLFPVLAERRKSIAGYLSGGEQQMLAIGRALMSSPELLLLDEPSLGLAPLIVEQIKDIIVSLNEQGTSVLLVEQNAVMALSIADHGYVIETGKVVRDGPGRELLADPEVQEAYLGTGESRVSFRDVKTYRRKRRWS